MDPKRWFLKPDGSTIAGCGAWRFVAAMSPIHPPCTTTSKFAVPQASLFRTTSSPSMDLDYHEPTSELPPVTRLVLFDLDKTLFDHAHCLERGIEAVYEQFPILFSFTLSELCTAYSSALDLAYNAAVRGEISWPESEIQRVVLFFQFLDLGAPALETCTRFRDIYRVAYRADRRATPGAFGTLLTLRSRGCKVAVVTNGSTRGQMEKVEGLGLESCVDGVITSEEVGVAKPDTRILEIAMERFGARKETTCLVGDDLEVDVRCAISAGVTPVWYRRFGEDTETEVEVDGTRVYIVRELSQILRILGQLV